MAANRIGADHFNRIDWRAKWHRREPRWRRRRRRGHREDARAKGLKNVQKAQRKTDWGVIASRAAGVIIFLAGIFFAARLCAASPAKTTSPITE